MRKATGYHQAKLLAGEFAAMLDGIEELFHGPEERAQLQAMYDFAFELRGETDTALTMLAIALDGIQRMDMELRRLAEAETEAPYDHAWQHHLACGRAEGYSHASTLFATLFNVVMESGKAEVRDEEVLND